MVQHNNLVNFLAWEEEAFAHTPADVFLQKTPTNFDVSIEELWTPLVTGAPLVIAKPNGHKDTAYLLELINTHGVTNLSMVPSQVSEREMWWDDENENRFSGCDPRTAALRLVVSLHVGDCICL